MPRNVRIFFGLCLALAVYLVCSAVWFALFPSAHYLAVLAKIPPDMREMIAHETFRNIMVSTSAWCVVVLLLGWLAAFCRQNWARWTLAGVFVLFELLMIGAYAFVAVHYHQNFNMEFHKYVEANWSSLRACAVIAAKIAIIFFAFTGDAQPWFKRRAKA